MAEVLATPETIKQRIESLAAGDVLTLQPGTYSEPITFLNRRGTDTQPILVRGAEGAVFDGGRSAEDFRIEGNIMAQKAEEYPGLWLYMHDAMITVRNCSNIILQSLDIRRCWPTAIYIQDSRATTICDSRIEDATFAIGAVGRTTRGINIKNVHWCQDVTRDRLWRQVRWVDVHDRKEGFPNGVDVNNDWRLYDGDFLRCFGIAGDVRVSDCRIEHAFNAIHAYNPNHNPALSRNFAVHDCSFLFIRDNVFELEEHAQNWWFYRNRIMNCHKWFSIEAQTSRFVYIFANLGWFTEKPGRPGNRTGGVFKLGTQPSADSDYQYMFNNSFALRAPYVKGGGVLRGFRHWANAVRYCSPGEGICDASAPFFENFDVDTAPADERFTSDWSHWNIEFADDVIRNETYTELLVRAGYGPFTDSFAEDPGFLNPLDPGEDGVGLCLADDRPNRRTARAQAVTLPDGSTAELPQGRDAGAFQDQELFRWREFTPMSASTV